MLMVCDLVACVSENLPELACVFCLFSFNPHYSMPYLSMGLLLLHSRLWGLKDQEEGKSSDLSPDMDGEQCHLRNEWGMLNK